MGYSGSYIIVESMIRQNMVMFSELEELVDSLGRRGLLSRREQKALLVLAKKILPKYLLDLKTQL
jgi:hypothetical protein